MMALSLLFICCSIIAFCCQFSGFSALSRDSLRVFLRFSPLIGGPKFLPLHVEVILNRNSDNTLYRFDFIPLKATDPSTLARLVTLQSVPGLLRSRTFDGYGSDTAEEAAAADGVDSFVDSSPSNDTSKPARNSLDEFKIILSTNGRDARSQIIRGRNGVTICLSTIETSIPTEIIAQAEDFTQLYQIENGELNLAQNSCYTFAYNLLRFLAKASTNQGTLK